MLGVENRTDMRRASLISEIYSEAAGPTGGNVVTTGPIADKNVVKTGGKEEPKGALAAAGIANLKGHPAFRPKRVTRSGLAKLGCKIDKI